MVVVIQFLACHCEQSGFNFMNAYTINSPPPRELLLEESTSQSNQVAILDSLLFLRDPLQVRNLANFFNPPNDGNTRVTIFVANLVLAQGETPSSVQINLVGSSNQNHDVVAEDVRTVFTVQPVNFQTAKQFAGRYLYDQSEGTRADEQRRHLSNSNLVRVAMQN